MKLYANYQHQVISKDPNQCSDVPQGDTSMTEISAKEAAELIREENFFFVDGSIRELADELDKEES